MCVTGSVGEPVGKGGWHAEFTSEIKNRPHEHKRNLELRIETKRTTYILGDEVYEEWHLCVCVCNLYIKLILYKILKTYETIKSIRLIFQSTSIIYKNDSY